MALNAVLVAFPRSRNTTASRRPGLDTTWLLMTRRLRGAWDPSRAFPITLVSNHFFHPPYLLIFGSRLHLQPHPGLTRRTFLLVPCLWHDRQVPLPVLPLYFGLQHLPDQCSVVQFKFSLRVVELPRVVSTCSVAPTLQCSVETGSYFR